MEHKMPRTNSILIEALVQIAGCNDREDISEIARKAAQRILSVEATALIQAEGGIFAPIHGARARRGEQPQSTTTRSATGRRMFSIAIDPVDEADRNKARDLCPKLARELPISVMHFSRTFADFNEAEKALAEIVAAQTLADAAMAAIVRCAELSEVKETKTSLELERDEVRHRLKNVYASAIGLANISLPKEYANDFSGRLRTLANVHSFLDDGLHGGVGFALRHVLLEVLSPYHDGTGSRIRIEGPDIEINPSMATALGLLANELATNALKHGSLSVNSGQIVIQWTFTDGELGFRWREFGGPKADAASAVPNQGSRLIRMIIEGQLRGKIVQSMTPSGLHFSTVVPIA